MQKLSEQPVDRDLRRSTKIQLIRARNTAKIGEQTSKGGFQRLKSTQNAEQLTDREEKPTLKPRSSMGKRPASSRKITDKSHSIATTSSARSEQQVKDLINTVFAHSKKVQNFLSLKGVAEKSAYNKLINNQIFMLSLVGVIQGGRDEPEQMTKKIETNCINKLQRILALDRQKNLCETIQNKIGSLLEQKIKQLSRLP